MAKSRKVRSDILVGNLEKKLGLEPGAIRNPDGSDARSNKKLETLRKEYSKAKGTKIKTNPAISSKAIAKASKAIKALSSATAKEVKTVQSTKAKISKKSSVTPKVITNKPISKKAPTISKSSTAPKRKITKPTIRKSSNKK